jgi:hypothetical protein
MVDLFAAGAIGAFSQIAQFAGPVLTAVGTIAGGAAAKEQADFKAKGLEMQANESRAASQRRAEERRQRGRLVLSQMQARAAASGTDATSGDVLGLTEDVAGRSEYQALTELYTGENRARGYIDQANSVRMSGENEKKGSFLKAASTIMGGARGIFSSFNSSGPTNRWDEAYG